MPGVVSESASNVAIDLVTNAGTTARSHVDKVDSPPITNLETRFSRPLTIIDVLVVNKVVLVQISYSGKTFTGNQKEASTNPVDIVF